MKGRMTKQLIIGAGVVLAFILLVIVIILMKFGSAYNKGISEVSEQRTPENMTHIERETINKIYIRKAEEKGCIEVNSDGAVRIYSVCQTEVVDAYRATDTRFILRLFKLISEKKIPAAGSGEQEAPCSSYQLTIETESGSRTVCASDLTDGAGGGSGNSDGGGSGSILDNIIDVINIIIDDIPPTPTPENIVPSPTPVSVVSGSPTPTGIYPTTPPTITPVPTVKIPNPFTCDFSGSSEKARPYYISNIICSSGPTPMP